MTTPWASNPTADNGVRKARILGTSKTVTTTPLSTGGTRTATITNTLDARGFITRVSSEASSGENPRCTATAYAADNSTAWIIGLPSIVTEYSKPCSQTPVIPADVLSHKRVAYDGAGVGTAATRGLVTSAWEASGFSGSTLDSAQWIQTVTNEYDAMGRPTKTTDAAQRTVQTAYVPAATAAAGAGPLASTTTTNPLGWTSKTTVDPYRGLPIEVVDENGKTSTTDYDARGRLVAAWGTDRPKAANPSSPTVAYQYTVSTTAPSSVKSTTLTPTGTMSTFTLFDGLGRVVQT